MMTSQHRLAMSTETTVGRLSSALVSDSASLNKESACLKANFLFLWYDEVFVKVVDLAGLAFVSVAS